MQQDSCPEENGASVYPKLNREHLLEHDPEILELVNENGALNLNDKSDMKAFEKRYFSWRDTS